MSIALTTIDWTKLVIAILFICGLFSFSSTARDNSKQLVERYWRGVDKVLVGDPRKVDEFGNINCENELARLDAFAVTLQNEPESRGYIIIYGGRTGKRNEAKARAARMLYYLTKRRGVNPKNVVTLDGGYRETLMGELWIASPTDQAPKATPTVDVKNVKLKGTAKIRNYSCSIEM